MTKFKIGDRVRLVDPTFEKCNLIALIEHIDHGHLFDMVILRYTNNFSNYDMSSNIVLVGDNDV